MPPLTDTSPDARRVLDESLRRLSPERKWKAVDDARRFARAIHAAGVRQRNPVATDEDIRRDWALRTLGEGPWLQRMRFEMQQQPIEDQEVIRFVLNAMRQEGISHAVGGSLASSFHGDPRYSRDADLTAEPFPGKEAAFVNYFDTYDYYVDLGAVQSAVRSRSTFNIIYLPTSFKVDVFIRRDRPFEQSLWSRRQTTTLMDPTGAPMEVVSPEDILLLKLEWYRLGGEVSDSQWDDVLGILRAQRGKLDDAYLDLWAADLGVTDLLAQARTDAATP